MMHWGYGWEKAGIFMLLSWIAGIAGIIYFIKAFSGSLRKEEKREKARDILEKRYIRNEITREEFENFKKFII